MHAAPYLLTHIDPEVRSNALRAFIEQNLEELQVLSRVAVKRFRGRVVVESEDVFQHVCACMLRRIGRAPMACADRVFAYFKTCCNNHIKNLIRAQRLHTPLPDDLPATESKQDYRETLHEILRAASESDRRIVNQIIALLPDTKLGVALKLVGCSRRRWSALVRRCIGRRGIETLDPRVLTPASERLIGLVQHGQLITANRLSPLTFLIWGCNADSASPEADWVFLAATA